MPWLLAHLAGSVCFFVGGLFALAILVHVERAQRRRADTLRDATYAGRVAA